VHAILEACCGKPFEKEEQAINALDLPDVLAYRADELLPQAALVVGGIERVFEINRNLVRKKGVSLRETQP